MYTMYPLDDVPPDHMGFWIVVVTTTLIWAIRVFDEWRDEIDRVLSTVVAVAVIAFSSAVSYVWTDQTTLVHKNQQVTGEFVRFVAEGWNESQSSGKTTRRVDVHKTYVIYRINGNEVLFEATTGIEYPKTAVFYKN
jgi:hypothetical protein